MRKLPSTAFHSGLAALVIAGCVFSTTVAAEEAAMHVATTTGTIDCSHRDVNVMAAHARLAFTGPCKGIYFIGRNTVASVESASLLQITEADVTVTAGNVAEVYVIGDNSRLDAGALGELRLQGNSAVIKAKSIKTLSVVGRGNKVSWRAGSPEVNDIGSNNTLSPAIEGS